MANYSSPVQAGASSGASPSSATISNALEQRIRVIADQLEVSVQTFKQTLEGMKITNYDRKKLTDSLDKMLTIANELLEQQKGSQPAANSLPRNQQAQASFNLGVKYMSEGNLEPAAEHFHQALDATISPPITDKTYIPKFYFEILEQLVACNIREAIQSKKAKESNEGNGLEEAKEEKPSLNLIVQASLLWELYEQQIDSGAISIDLKKRKEYAFLAGLGYLDQMNYKPALDYFNHVINLESLKEAAVVSALDIVSSYAMGYSNEHLGRYTDAIEIYKAVDKALEKKKEDGTSFLSLDYKLIPGFRKVDVIDDVTIKMLLELALVRCKKHTSPQIGDWPDLPSVTASEKKEACSNSSR